MTETLEQLRRLGRLSVWQWYVLLAAPFVLVLTRRRLRRRGYRATLAAARSNEQDNTPGAEQLAAARDTAYAVAVALKYGPWQPLCLLRSLTLGWFLGRRGIPFELRIGVAEGVTLAAADAVPGSRPDFTAHAWVECGGEVLNDGADVAATYRAFGGGPGASR